jgi:hypothetical protein
MYFFDTADYYTACMFGKYAQIHNDSIGIINGEAFGDGDLSIGGDTTQTAFLRALKELLLSLLCPEGVECEERDNEVLQNLMTAQLQFLKQAYIFWNMFNNPANWNLPNTGQIVHTGVVLTDVEILNLTGSIPDTTTVSVDLDYGNAIKSYEYINNYTEAFKTFNCEVRKAISYFTNTTFEMPDITNYHYIDENDYDDYINSQP